MVMMRGVGEDSAVTSNVEVVRMVVFVVVLEVEVVVVAGVGVLLDAGKVK